MRDISYLLTRRILNQLHDLAANHHRISYFAYGFGRSRVAYAKAYFGCHESCDAATYQPTFVPERKLNEQDSDLTAIFYQIGDLSPAFSIGQLLVLYNTKMPLDLMSWVAIFQTML